MNIDHIIKQKGMTKKALSEVLGMSRENLHRVLSGNPTLSNIERIASALGVPVWQLFADHGNEINGFVEYRGTVYRVASFEDLRNILKLAE